MRNHITFHWLINVFKKAKIIFLFFIACLLLSVKSNAQSEWGYYRGMNVSPYIKKEDLKFLADINVNLVRVSFNLLPFIKKQPPYDFNEEAFTRLDSIIDWCKQLRIFVVIDPHTIPGTQLDVTTSFRDPFWNDTSWQKYLIGLWMKLSSKYKTEKQVAGYDLLNEPALVTSHDDDPGSWNQLFTKIIEAIRKNGDNHSIIIETPAGEIAKGKWLNRITSIITIKLPNDKNIVISPHIYEPQKFTHQGVNGKETGYHFPGKIDNQFWDEDELEKMVQPIAELQKKWNVPIYIGEFSASRYAGVDGDKYVESLIKIFEKYHWSWTYHAFRSEPPNTKKMGPWDAEMSVTDLNTNERFSNSPRMQILEKYFQLNKRKK